MYSRAMKHVLLALVLALVATFVVCAQQPDRLTASKPETDIAVTKQAQLSGGFEGGGVWVEITPKSAELKNGRGLILTLTYREESGTVTTRTRTCDQLRRAEVVVSTIAFFVVPGPITVLSVNVRPAPPDGISFNF